MNTELPKEIAIHPITLLSIVDHYSRSVGVKKNKRIVGALLGKSFEENLELAPARKPASKNSNLGFELLGLLGNVVFYAV